MCLPPPPPAPLAPECYLEPEAAPAFYAGPSPRTSKQGVEAQVDLLRQALGISEAENAGLRQRIEEDIAIRRACAASAPKQ